MIAMDVSILKASMVAVMAAGILIIVAVALVAIAAKRPGLAAAMGGLFLLAIGMGAVLFPVLLYTSRAQVTKSEWQVGPVSMEQHVGDGPQELKINGGFSLTGVLLFVALPIALVVALVRRLRGRRPEVECGNQGRWWPALLLIPVVLLFFWGTARIHTSTSRPGVHVANQFDAVQHDLARRNAEMGRRTAEMHANVGRQIAHMDIHELMDKVDAPRIEMIDQSRPIAVTAPVAVASLKTTEATPEASPSDDKHPAEVVVEAAMESKVADKAGTAEAAASAEVRVEAEAAEIPRAERDEAAIAEKSTGSHASDKSDRERADSPTEPPGSPHDESEGGGGKDESVGDEKTRVTAAQPRPDWTNDPPEHIGNIRREVIVTDEYATDGECFRAAQIYKLLKTYERIQTLSGRPFVDSSLPSLTFHNNVVLADGKVISSIQASGWADPRLQLLSDMGIDSEFVHTEIVKAQFLESTERSFGPMKKLYTQIEFSPAVDRELRRRWNAYQRQERFATVGLGAGGVLGLLGLVFGLLKIDTWTKGYYTKRLFLGVPAAIIGGFLLLIAIDIAT